MILIADGGSSKVHWSLIDEGKELINFFSTGANPFHRTKEDITADFKEVLTSNLTGYPIDKVYFLGSGCVPERRGIVEDAIANSLNTSHIEVNTDLFAAAKGLCGKEAGIACIIGTGSNSCYYNGEDIIDNVSPLGYILGDEGSGAVLGRLFINACLKNQLSKGIRESFLIEYQLTPALILNKVYKREMPNRFLAGFSPFILKNIDDKTVYSLVYNAFKEFFIKNVMQYDYMNHKVHFTGSIAYYYQEVLISAARELNIETGTIVASPMQGLIEYYSQF